MLKILISTICLAFASCETKTAYHYYQSIPSNGWEQTDTLIFHFPTSLVSHDYMLCFGIRHLQNYLYKDIWLAMSTPSMQHPDTIHLYLANQQGLWKGRGTSGGIYQYASDSIPISLLKSDSTLRIWHIMQDTSLHNISDVGIRLMLAGTIYTKKDKKQNGKTP